jgi:hypothetical protein
LLKFGGFKPPLVVQKIPRFPDCAYQPFRYATMVVAVPPHFQQVYHCAPRSIAPVAPHMKQVIIATFCPRPSTSPF